MEKKKSTPMNNEEYEPDPVRFYKWTVEFEVNEIWVADGFNLTNDRAKEWIENDLGFSYPEETKAKVIKSPSAKVLKKFLGDDIE